MHQIYLKACAQVAYGLLAVCIVAASGCSDDSQPSSEATKIEYARNAPESIEHSDVPPFVGATHLQPVRGDSNIDGQVRPADFSWQQSGPSLPPGGGQKLNAADAWNEELRTSQPGRPAESLYPRENSRSLAGSAPRYQGEVDAAAAPMFQATPPWPVPEVAVPEVAAPAVADSESTEQFRQPPPPETYGPRFDFDPPTDIDAKSQVSPANESLSVTAEHPYQQSNAPAQRNSASKQTLPWKITPWESDVRVAAASSPALPPAVARQSEELTKRAFELAGRGATYSAREQLIRALEVVAESLDAAEQTIEHRRALAAAFRALDEAVDFAPRGATLLQEIDIKTVVSGHLTPVVKGAAVDLSQISAVECSRAYYTFAQQQLAFACGSQQAASLALYGLGKLNTGLAESGTDQLQDAATRSIVFHQAALSVDNGNWRAANELAVQLARSSRYEEARGWLQHATQLSDSSELWSNLASVHGYLGEERLAREASARSERLAQRTSPGSSQFNVQWLPPQAFTGAPPNR